MTGAPHDIDSAGFLEGRSRDRLRTCYRTCSAHLSISCWLPEADDVCGAAYGAINNGRVNRRNGYRHRNFGTRRQVEVKIPELR